MSDSIAPLKLKKKEERRLRNGHVWVFSNEVDTVATPLSDFEAGDAVEIQSASGKVLGTGYANPNSLICARLVSRDPKYPLNRSLMVHRLKIALSLRERIFPEPCYRLCYAESDGLPGLVVDRFNDVLVVQINTAGMEARREDIIAALQQVVKPQTIIFRNDSSIRKMEGLDSYTKTVVGEELDQVRIQENGTQFQVPVLGGQKTGWFYDQRDNRARQKRYVQDARVLDVFSYIGAWGVEAAMFGAKDVMCVDSSESALDQVAANAKINGVSDKVATLQGDAFEALSALRAERERFDVVIVDPPAFIKRKKDHKAGLQAYNRINQLAMRLLSRDGILISASCSSHLKRDQLNGVLHQSARHVDRTLQLIELGQQAPDHPVHPAIPETEYLKAQICRLVVS